ncbi:MAG: hypothetical protein Roseis2KO_17150 [Roseivirga sp.]
MFRLLIINNLIFSTFFINFLLEIKTLNFFYIMAYTVSQSLSNLLDAGEFAAETKNNWSDTITSDNEAGYFITVTEMSIAEGAAQREITVSMIASEHAPEENTVDTGCYERQAAETSVKVTLLDQNGKEVASNVTEYPA